MQIAYVDIKNFRGIYSAKVYFKGHSVIIGDNNAGKSTIFEAIDLTLGPDRLSRIPVVDEHDFFNGNYYDEKGVSPKIEIEILITDLEVNQVIKFKNHLEFWDINNSLLLSENSIQNVDLPTTKESLRVKFIGSYNLDDDDFEGETYFCSPVPNDGQTFTKFSKYDKRECGFLYLRALRTGARALSMERGSLLDIILRLKEIRPKMWEDVLRQLRTTDVAVEPSIGIKGILENVQSALKEFVPSDWGSEPLLRVSDLTREHLRKTLTIFMSTGVDTYHAPFQHQGTGTVNTMVLALLSMIAEAKNNVIFAMEEPEIAIPPYTQKRIIDSIRKKSSQAIFTSHSPFVLEEFQPDQIVLVSRDLSGILTSQPVHFPKNIKPKSYNSEFRIRFSEALLAKRVLLTEGATEATSFAAAGRILNQMAPSKFSSLESMGIAVFDVMAQSAVASYGEYFSKLGKLVFAVFDKQTPEDLERISQSVSVSFESQHNGFEDLLMEETEESVIKLFVQQLIADNEWPTHLEKPNNYDDIENYKLSARECLRHKKGSRGAAELLSLCKTYEELPITIRNVLETLKDKIEGNKKI